MALKLLSDFFRNKKVQPWLLAGLPGENECELEARRHQAYFDEQQENSHEWLKRMDIKFNLDGMRILDLGCGHGALSVLFAEFGVSEIVAMDLDEERIAFAKKNLEEKFPQYKNKVKFLCEDVCKLTDDNYFDLIISKDSFEHIDNLAFIITQLNRLLKPGGYLAAGFSPLYYSPFGDHARFATRIPWLHSVLPEALLIWQLNFRSNSKVECTKDLGLNKLTPSQFRKMFEVEREWNNVDIKYNRGDKSLLQLFNILRHIPLMEKFFTISIYASAQKSSNNAIVS